MAGNPTTPIPSVRVLWRPEQFDRISNGTFETNTTGWLATAGINAAGTSITRVTTDAHTGSACASVVCTATDTSGVNFDLGADRFYAEPTYGSIHVATGWVKRVSGSARLRVTLGSLGTAADRATLTITDLVDDWQPFAIRWLPSASRTDAELAITNGSAEALTFLLDDVKVYLLDAFSQCENGSFETNTTGWITTAETFTVDATSITRITSGGFGGDCMARVVTTASANSGVTFDLGARTFISGRTYRLRYAAKAVAGTADIAAVLGSGTGDRTIETETLTDTTWRWYTQDWTPSADRATAQVAFRSSGTAVTTFDVDEVQVYEAADDLGTDVHSLRWSRSLDGIGTINVQVADADGAYHPRNTSATLYGSLAPGKRIWGTAIYGGFLYPLFYGTLTTIEPPALGGIHTDLNAEDVMGDLARAQHAAPFLLPSAWSYGDVRQLVIDAVVTGQPRRLMRSTLTTAYLLGQSRTYLPNYSIESGTLYYGTDDIVTAADALRDLNEATQSVHHILPSVHANIGWRYTAVDRGLLTDTSSGFTVDESDPPTDLTSVRFTMEGLETRQIVPWQAYERLPEPPQVNLVQAYDRASYAGSASLDAEDPYLHFTDETYGDSLDVPEPSYQTVRRLRRRKKGRRVVTSRRRIFPAAFVPFTMAAGETRRVVVEFAVAVEDFDWSTAVVSGSGLAIDVVEVSPMRLVLDLVAQAAATVKKFTITGMPYAAMDEQEVQADVGADAYPGPSFGTPYIPSRAMAEGVAAYRNWRWGTPPLRPVLHDLNNFPRTLTAKLADHFTVTSTRWRLSALLFVSTGCTWEVTRGGLEWRSWHELEELPDHTEWFVLDSSGINGADILAP